MFRLFMPVQYNVRMAERSKAPDSRYITFSLIGEHSGPRMRAWVRIPLLTTELFVTFSH